MAQRVVKTCLLSFGTVNYPGQVEAIVRFCATHFPTLPTQPGWDPSRGKQSRGFCVQTLSCPRMVLTVCQRNKNLVPPPRVVLFTGLKELQNVELISVDREWKSVLGSGIGCIVEKNHAVIF